MTKFRLKKNDPVIIKSGRKADRNKVGKIMRMVPDQKRVVVEKIHMVHEYVRPNPQKNIKGGIMEKEGTIPIEKVMYYCKECEQGVRLGYKMTPEGKQRTCKKCGAVID